MIVWRLVILGLSILAAGCRYAPEARTYQLTGQVLAVRSETNEILVKHDDIKGFMPAMTMPYAVKDAALLAGRTPGDLITATLVVETNFAHLTAITKTGSAPIPDDARKTIPAAAGVSLLTAGDPVPDTTLSDQDDKPLTLKDFAGAAAVNPSVSPSRRRLWARPKGKKAAAPVADEGLPLGSSCPCK